jgi:hypothetical protein
MRLLYVDHMQKLSYLDSIMSARSLFIVMPSDCDFIYAFIDLNVLCNKGKAEIASEVVYD